jgi:alpha-L-rhamnosidase
MLYKGTGIFLMILTTLTGAAEEVFSGAEWLQDPRFAEIETIDFYHKENEKGPEPEGPKNIHTLFRKTIQLREKPVSALLAITGDDYYKLYINGVFAVQGPEPGYPFVHPYYWLDASEFLEAGENCLAAHCFYQGLLNRVWNSADNRAGFIAALEVTYADGEKERFTTDTTWKYHDLRAFSSEETTGYSTQFIEDIDMRLVPADWRRADFDDSAWKTPAAGFQDHHFVRQITPPLQVRRVTPARIEAVEDGRWFYDFGMEIAGHTRIRIQGPEGHVITVRHGEELKAPEKVRYKMRCNCTYEEKAVLTGEKDLIEFYDYRAFRYMEILDAPEEPEVWVDARHHPFDPEKAAFKSEYDRIESIWTLCRNGVWTGSQGGFLDCPTREKGTYLGDAVITARSHMWLTGDTSLTKKTIWDFMQSRRICPGIMAVAPGSFMQEIAEYSLQYPLLLREYYRHSGDREFLEEAVDTVFDGLYGYFAAYENDAGLLTGMDEKWVLVDWPKNLRDGYDYDYAEKRANTVLNAFYYGALRTGAELLRELGRDATLFEARADRVEKAFAEYIADPDTGLYLDAPGSSHSALHANAIPLAFGLTAGADPAKMIALIRKKRLNCGVYIASYVIEACFRNGAADLGWELITSDDLHSWNTMLEAGATTCMEAWGPDQKWNTSFCHPWSSSPIYLLAEHVLGLSPAEPGWKKIRVAPRAIPDLPAMKLTVPHPAGRITVQYTPGESYRVTVPEGVPVEADAPAGIPVTVNDTRSHARPILTLEDRQFLEKQGWQQRAGGKTGVWVDADNQRFTILEGMQPIWQGDCSTAEAGIGCIEDSLQTPPGWHRVAAKSGEDAPIGRVFRARRATDERWRPGTETGEDLVLTRVIWLEGLEDGVNRGKDAEGRVVDSKKRCIYIHGTNQEDRIGTPASHGCVRLLNDDVIEAFQRIPEGAPVLITKRFGE